MKTKYGILTAVLGALLMFTSCEKDGTGSIAEDPQKIGTYTFNGEEYPVNSMTEVADENVIAIMISPQKDVEKKSTYAVIGINAALEGKEIDIEKAWHNDDYYFIYEDPLRYYSQYRKLTSGTLTIRRSGDRLTVSADLILPDGTDFQFHCSGKTASSRP